MTKDIIDVAYIARLARIDLTEEEATRMALGLDKVLDYMSLLKQYDVEGVEPMAHPLPHSDVLRADEVRPSLSQDAAMSNAPQQENDQIVVPKVVDSAG